MWREYRISSWGCLHRDIDQFFPVREQFTGKCWGNSSSKSVLLGTEMDGKGISTKISGEKVDRRGHSPRRFMLFLVSMQLFRKGEVTAAKCSVDKNLKCSYQNSLSNNYAAMEWSRWCSQGVATMVSEVQRQHFSAGGRMGGREGVCPTPLQLSGLETQLLSSQPIYQQLASDKFSDSDVYGMHKLTKTRCNRRETNKVSLA